MAIIGLRFGCLIGGCIKVRVYFACKFLGILFLMTRCSHCLQ
jgi:hypothetical protein